MSVETVDRTRLGGTDGDGAFEENHFFCECNPNLGLCGTDISDHDFASDEMQATCAVCADMEDLPCPRCGC
jgi:hypothetical protein